VLVLDANAAQIPDDPFADPPVPLESRVAERLGRRRLARGAAAAAVIVAASVTLVGIRLTSGTGSIGWRACCAEATLIGSSNGDVESSLALKSTPTAAVAKHGVLWVTSSSSGLVDRIDMQDHGLTRVAVGGSPTGVAISHGLVWVADSSGRDLLRISPKSEHVVGHLDVCNGPLGVTAGLGDLWVACPLDGMVVEIDPATNTIKRRITIGPTPTDLTVAAGDVWVTLESAGEIARYDPHTRTVATSAVGEGPSTVVAGGGDLWVADTLNRAVARVQASSGIVESVTPVGSAPEALAAAAGGVWSAEPNAARLELVSGRPAKVTRVVRTPNPVVALTDDGGQVAAAATLSVARRRGGTVRFAVSEPLPPRPDPAVSFNTTALEIEVVTNDGLLAFRRTSGALGEILVPDLAEALPEMSDSGRVWTMTVRNGLRYSTGRPIRAADIRYGLERAFEAGAPPLPLYEDIVGAPECKPHDPCDLSRGIVVHGQTITFRLRRPDADFPDKLALPVADAVPVGWPAPPSNPEGTVGVVPATGPYLIHSYTPGRSLILTRNPDFHQWSADAQPAGYPNQIVEEAESGVTGLERAVLRHRVDVAVLDRRSLLSWARARYPGEVDEDADPESAWEAVNTRRAPFDDVRVRQALGYAVDRGIAAATDVGARPSCQILPPAFPGYAPYCMYSAPGGQIWGRPDLARARQLIKASGAQGSRVRVVVVRKYVNNTRVVAKALRQLGLRGTFVTVSLEQAIQLVARSPARFNLVATGSAADYPSPSDYFDELFTCKSFVPHTTANRNLSEYCSPRIDAMIARATRLGLVSSARANRMWTKVDHAISRQAPVIPLYSYGVATWVSPRVRDFMYSPFAGALLDQLWRASPNR